ncbi:MAG: hypothetical protein L0241_08840 [Planctomycetia bacterium]|nr:hypothetical protein [Planctomycetia bacterium]
MAAWLTVYCSRSVDHITADDLLAFLRNLDDPHTLAEGFGIEDEDEVNRAFARLKIETVTDTDGLKFAIHYKTAKDRPIYFHLWAKRSRVKAEREEALEGLEEAKGRNVKRVRTHLAKMVEVIALELGWNQLEDMGIVLAGQIAEFIAVEGDGLILDQNDDWWAMKNQLPVLLVGERNRP